jgi:Uma2 family endonuclease
MAERYVVQTGERMTAAEFLELPEMNLLIELINGEVIMSPTPVPAHQRSVLRLARMIEDVIPNSEVFIAPMAVHLDEANVVEPDVLWVREYGRCRVLEKYLEGVPDLVVEVLSPGTARRDRREKFDLYERFGVSEYWLVDPEAQFIEAWRLEDGRFARQGVYGPGERFECAVLGGKLIEMDPVFGTG